MQNVNIVNDVDNYCAENEHAENVDIPDLDFSAGLFVTRRNPTAAITSFVSSLYIFMMMTMTRLIMRKKRVCLMLKWCKLYKQTYHRLRWIYWPLAPRYST